MSAPGHLSSEPRLLLASSTAGHLGVSLVRRGPVRRVPRPPLPRLPRVLSVMGHLGSCEPRLMRASFAVASSAVASSAIALSAVDLFCRVASFAVGLVHREPPWSEPRPPWATLAVSPVCCGHHPPWPRPPRSTSEGGRPPCPRLPCALPVATSSAAGLVHRGPRPRSRLAPSSAHSCSHLRPSDLLEWSHGTRSLWRTASALARSSRRGKMHGPRRISQVVRAMCCVLKVSKVLSLVTY